MKYEFKPFSIPYYVSDLDAGWKPCFRSDVDKDVPREVVLTFLPECSHPRYRVCSTDVISGDVYQHDPDGRFDVNQGETLLDILMRRPVKVERTVPGMAYVDAAGEIVSLRCMEDSTEKVATSLTPVPCTITLHASA